MGLLTVRRATADDARGIATVRVRSWQSGYRGLIPDDYLDNMSIDENEKRSSNWFSDTTTSHHWVCTHDSQVVGWASVFPKARDSTHPTVAELAACYVLPDFWGSGVGFKLWSKVASALAESGATQVVLWVLDTNQRAISFYERQGFQMDGATKAETLMPGVTLKEIRLRISL